MIATEPLMWSHYAEEHKGICYCFDRSNIFHQISTNYSLEDAIHSGEIIYSNKMPEIQCVDHLQREELITLELIKILLTKSINWAYEKEYRYFTKRDSNTVYFNPQSLQAIFVGLRVEESEKQKISTLVKQYNIKHNTKVIIAYARKSPRNYEMEIASKGGTITNRRYSWI